MPSTNCLMATLCAGILALGAGRHASVARGASPVVSALAGLDDQGVFILTIGGRNVGTEKFDIRSDRDKVEAKAEIRLHIEQQGKALDFSTFPTLALNSELRPLTYTWSQKGAQAARLEVDFRASPAKSRYRTVTGTEDNRDFELSKDVVVLDDNVLHHYQLLAKRYESTAGGKQTFKAFIPQEALPGEVNVEDAGNEPVEIGGRTETLRHLVVTTELTRIDLWVDEQRRLQRVLIPAVQLEAVRKK